jgi:hypothetical protein
MLMNFLRDVEDHRRGQGKRYDLAGVLMCTILAGLSGAHSYRRIHVFIKTHFRALRPLLGLSWRRSPSLGQLRDILAGVSAASLEGRFRAYSAALAEAGGQGTTVLACDGKALRGSFDHAKDSHAAQLLSVFADDRQLILAQVEIAEKTNEIPAFQALVKTLGLMDKLFTLDAMHCQKKHSRR